METITYKAVMTEDANVSSRIEANKNALKIIKEYPFKGVGLGNYTKFARRNMNSGNKVFLIHNSFLQIGAEAGVLALMSFMGIIFFSIKILNSAKKVFSNYNNKFLFIDSVIASILGYCLISLFQPVAFNRLFFIFVAFSACIPNIMGSGRTISSKASYATFTKLSR